MFKVVAVAHHPFTGGAGQAFGQLNFSQIERLLVAMQHRFHRRFNR